MALYDRAQLRSYWGKKKGPLRRRGPSRLVQALEDFEVRQGQGGNTSEVQEEVLIRVADDSNLGIATGRRPGDRVVRCQS